MRYSREAARRHRHHLRRFRLFSGFGCQVEAAAVEVDRMDEVLFVPKAPSRVLHPLDLRIDRFAGRIGDPVP